MLCYVAAFNNTFNVFQNYQTTRGMPVSRILRIALSSYHQHPAPVIIDHNVDRTIEYAT